MLFELKDSAGLLVFHRIDQTHHYGYSFGANYFTLNDTIYSLGGYGFWRHNGQLRYFDYERKGWELVKLNREIPMGSVAGWVDQKRGALYVYATYPLNQAIKQREDEQAKGEQQKLYRLDVKQGNWQELGKMILIFNEPAENLNFRLSLKGEFNFNAFLPAHLVTVNRDLVYLDDFIQNNRWRPTESFYKKFHPFGGQQPTVLYTIDSVVYMSEIKTNDFDSVRITASDFKLTNEKVYEPFEELGAQQETGTKDNLIETGWLLAGAVFGFLLFPLFTKLRKRRTTPEPLIPAQRATTTTDPVIHVPVSPSASTPLFDELETELIHFVIEKCKIKTIVSVTDVNRILGLAGKNEPVQKKNRSEKINSINDKWMRVMDKNTPIIHRKRSELDKRIIEYYILAEDILAVEEKL